MRNQGIRRIGGVFFAQLILVSSFIGASGPVQAIAQDKEERVPLFRQERGISVRAEELERKQVLKAFPGVPEELMDKVLADVTSEEMEQIFAGLGLKEGYQAAVAGTGPIRADFESGVALAFAVGVAAGIAANAVWQFLFTGDEDVEEAEELLQAHADYEYMRENPQQYDAEEREEQHEYAEENKDEFIGDIETTPVRKALSFDALNY